MERIKESVILVDKNDFSVGECEKLEAHKKGLLHRAISVFVFNSKGELLLQKRALGKYHSAGLWTNTCCSHPRPNEGSTDAAKRRLNEEMGIVCDLRAIFKFNYEVSFGNGLIENEFDHVFVGFYDGDVKINPDEVSEFVWVDYASLSDEIYHFPNRYTHWFKLIYEKVFSFLV